MKNSENLDIDEIIHDYGQYMGVEAIALKQHVGKKKIKEILINAGVTLRGIKERSRRNDYIVEDWRTQKYSAKNGYHYIAVSKNGEYTTNDYMNNGGFLTKYILQKYGIPTPSLHARRQYYRKTGNYWWEQWFNILLVLDKETKKCPYCDWETVDLANKSGAFQMHLQKEHGLSLKEYLIEHPEDTQYFEKYGEKEKRKSELQIEGNYVICPICQNRYWRITESHVLKEHGMTLAEFRKQHPNTPVMSKNNYQQTLTAQTLGNLTVSKKRFISNYEREIRDFLDKNNISYQANRQILIGKEIDILIEDKKIGIEFDGLKWHTEWFGRKPHGYHLQKTEMCNQKGYGLIHIFEDEFVNHKEIVLNKLSHLLGLDINNPRIPARKCKIREILKNDAEDFLNKYHIQGYYKSSVYLGAFYADELVAVMCFKNGNVKNSAWELTRFATVNHAVVQGVGGKLFSYFLKHYTPQVVVSFADRRWTLNANDNLYTKLGFNLEKKCPPDYRYYNENVERYKRVHKMSFSKQSLHKKYGFPLSMTEVEMAKELGYDRIWDCGLFKYVWKANKNYETR